MFNITSSSGGKGSGYIILNVVRVLNIIVLTTVAAASVVFMVVGKMPDGFTFFNDISLAFVVVSSIILVISEIDWKYNGFFNGWIEDNFPVISSHRGFTWLGAAMIILGSHTLGRLSDPRNSPKTMTLPLWRLCIGAGILAIIFGFVNTLLSWLFKGPDGQNARGIRKNGATNSLEQLPEEGYSSHRTNSVKSNKSVHKEKKRRTFFGRANKQASESQSALNSRPTISHPIPQDQYHHDLEKGYPRDDEEESIESRRSPIMPDVIRPPQATHPIFRNSLKAYSVASHIDRY